MADFLFVLSSSLILGTINVLLVVLGGDDRQRILGLMTGGFLTPLIVTLFLGMTWTPQSFAIAYASGLPLGWGLFDQAVCLYILGVSRTMPTSIGLQLVSMSPGGALLFGERCQGTFPPFGAGAIVALALGVWLASRYEKSESADGLDWPRGIRLLAASTIGLAAYLLLIQWFGTDGRTALLPQAFGCMTVALIFTAPCFTPWDDPADTRRSARTPRQVIPGMMWGCAVLILQVSADRVGATMGFTLSQLGTLISTPAGISLLGESRTHKEMRWTILGAALVTCGTVLAGFAKSLDPV